MSASNGFARHATLACLALSLAFAAFRCTGGASCLRNSDCPSGNVCQAGACTLPPVASPPSDAGADAPNDAAPDARPDSGPDSGGMGGAPAGGAGEGGASEQ
jgi:Cys-rich repeat protein